MLDSLMRLLRGEPVDRIVWTADITYWLAGARQRGEADPAWDSEAGFLQLHQQLGILPYYRYETFWAGEPVYDQPIKQTWDERDDQRIDRIHAPSGVLTQVSAWMPQSTSSGVLKHYVETRQDLRVLNDVLRHRRLRPVNLDTYRSRRRAWADADGLPCLGLPRSPLAAMVYEWCGIDHFAYLLADYPSEVATAMALLAAQEDPIIEAVRELAPPLVHFPDNLTSANFTSYYDDYLADHYVHRLERLHAAGIKAAVHLDGTVRGLLPRLVATGLDVVEAITPMPGGDCSVEEIAALASHMPTVIWGGVPGIMFAPPFTWSDLKVHVLRTIDAWRDRPFVLGVADQVPPDGDLEHCRRIGDLLAAAHVH